MWAADEKTRAGRDLGLKLGAEEKGRVGFIWSVCCKGTGEDLDREERWRGKAAMVPFKVAEGVQRVAHWL